MADPIDPTVTPVATTDTNPTPTPAVAPVATEAPAPVVPAAPNPAPVVPAVPVATVAPVPPVVAPAPTAEAFVASHADPRVHGVESMLAEKGLTVPQVQEIFQKAFETQDVKDVDMEKLKAHLGEAGAKLAMQNLEAFSADVHRASKTLYDTAVNLTGGEESYKQFSQWVQGNADADVQQLRDAVAQGGKLAYLALNELNSLWRTNSQHAVGHGALLTPDSGSAGTTLVPFENRREYVNAMKEAYKTRDNAKVDAVRARFAVRPV